MMSAALPPLMNVNKSATTSLGLILVRAGLVTDSTLTGEPAVVSFIRAPCTQVSYLNCLQISMSVLRALITVIMYVITMWGPSRAHVMLAPLWIPMDTTAEVLLLP